MFFFKVLHLATCSGDWRVGIGEWGLESGDWRVGIGEWGLESGDWRVGIGEWGLEIGDWSVGGVYPQTCSTLVRPTALHKNKLFFAIFESLSFKHSQL